MLVGPAIFLRSFGPSKSFICSCKALRSSRLSFICLDGTKGLAGFCASFSTTLTIAPSSLPSQPSVRQEIIDSRKDNGDNDGDDFLRRWSEKVFFSKSGKRGALLCTRHLLDQFKLFAGIDKEKQSLRWKETSRPFLSSIAPQDCEWWQGAKGLARRRQKYWLRNDWLVAAN